MNPHLSCHYREPLAERERALELRLKDPLALAIDEAQRCRGTSSGTGPRASPVARRRERDAVDEVTRVAKTRLDHELAARVRLHDDVTALVDVPPSSAECHRDHAALKVSVDL